MTAPQPPGGDKATPAAAMARVLAIMARLRGPAGCPWDAEQTFATIAPYTLEEAYEVVGAVERGDMTALRDELGDLLLQVVFHAQIAAEAGAFTFADVAAGLADKLVRRHPHVFSDATAADSAAVLGVWEAAKAAERAAAGPGDGSVLDTVEPALPALLRAGKLQAKAAKHGFDWPDAAAILVKLQEEIAELEAELPGGDADRLADEYGDVLFVAANLGNKLGVDGETAMRAAIAKFSRRFRHVERRLGERLGTAGLAEMDALWQEAKALEKSPTA